MEILELINNGSKLLKDKRIYSHKLDSEILLSKVLKKTREELIINLEQKITPQEIREFNTLIDRRSLKEPIAYILKEKEFWNKKFMVSYDTLIPRPETEILIDAAIKNLLGKKLAKVENTIELKLKSNVNLIEKMSGHHLKSGGKRLRALLTLGSAKLSGYELGDRDINLAACVELIHSATLLHDDVIDESSLRRGVKTTNSIWGLSLIHI